MQVKATKLGYYDLKRRAPGAVFEIDPKLFSKSWMQKLVGDVEAPAKKSGRKIEKVEAETEDMI